MTDNFQISRFAVNEKPYCVWDWDITKHNLRFLESFDPRYFEYFASTHADLLDGDEKQYAAIVLRTAYSQGLETLFALLCATVQAPDCVVGWLLKYQNEDLKKVIQKIHNQQPVLSKLPLETVSWQNLANIIVAGSTGDNDRDIRVRNSFAKLWKRLAEDFLKEQSSYEYNSIKHGLRVSMGGFHLAIGLENEPDAAAPPENMHTLGSSTFGSSFYVAEHLQDKLNFRVKRYAVNWNPHKFVYALNLISLSIQNIISYLRLGNGVSLSNVVFNIPKDESYFDLPWEQRVIGFSGFNMNSIIEPDWIKPLSRQEILAVYTDET